MIGSVRKELLQSHLNSLQWHLCEFLKECLPKICKGDWWMICVRSARIPGSQARDIRSGRIKTLEELDFSSLVMALKSRWSEIIHHHKIQDSQKQGKLLCDNLHHLRNRLAHLAQNDLSVEDTQAALGDLKKILTLLDRFPELLAKVESDWQEQGRKLFDQAPSDAPPANDKPAEEKKKKRKKAEGPTSDLIAPRRAIKGIHTDILLVKGEAEDRLKGLLKKATYVGIDFGTSTTVASVVCLEEKTGRLWSEPIPIPQQSKIKQTVQTYLLPSCLAWWNKELFIGQGAADLKPELKKGVNLWTSFKMELGVDLGNQYYNSKLQGKDAAHKITKPQHAAEIFFKYLREKIELWVEEKELPTDIRYAVSVPASFEHNQRSDLCKILGDAGISLTDGAIIDEPNAAFIGQLLLSLKDGGEGMLGPIQNKSKRILVFDFGAGTCDVSVLEVSHEKDRLVSKNLAISQFSALGGDNIDRAIAKRLLWPKMKEKCSAQVHFTTSEIQQVIIPKLMPTAEKLKIQCCKLIAKKWMGAYANHLSEYSGLISTHDVEPFSIIKNAEKVKLSLSSPSISLTEFFSVMEPFMSVDKEKYSTSSDQNEISVFKPIENVLQKAQIKEGDLDQVLFIGGSALNPLILEAVQKKFGRFVECITSQDIRTPVSRGTAIHSLTWNGLEEQLIQPILSESVYVLTTDDRLHSILGAGTPIPSDDITFSDCLVVPNEDQMKLQVPICVSSKDKILGNLEIAPNGNVGFAKGEPITLACRVDESKLIELTVKVGTSVVSSNLLNPLSNGSQTPEKMRRLVAKQKLNDAAVKGTIKEEPHFLLNYAEACSEAGYYLEAAENYELIDRLFKECRTSGIATSICYNFGMAGEEDRSHKWAKIAYERNLTWISAFNVAIGYNKKAKHTKAIGYLDEALEIDPDEPAIHYIKGQTLDNLGKKDKAKKSMQLAVEGFRKKLEWDDFDMNDLHRGKNAARALGDEDFLSLLNDWEKEQPEKVLYNPDYLAKIKEEK